MTERRHLDPENHPNRPRRLTAMLAAALLTPLIAVGCGPRQEGVCSGHAEHIVLVPSTSMTDYDVSVELTPAVARQVVRRVARSCGRLTFGIQDGRPDANLELHSLSLAPEQRKAYSPEAITRQLVEKGDAYAQKNLIEPLDASEATGGSPFFSTMAKIGDELRVHGWEQGTIVLVGDGLVVERPPGGGPMIRFGVEAVPEERVSGFVPLLRSLRGSCVVLVGAGATSKLPGDRIRAAQQILSKTVERAGIGFVATRSPELPPDCSLQAQGSHSH